MRPNPRLSSAGGTVYWVVLLPEGPRPRVGRLVFEDGGWFLVMDDGSRIPVRLAAPPPASSLDELPEPDYDAFHRWCMSSASEETCGKYVSYLRRFRWPLRREDVYGMELTKWHVLALRSYLNYLEERGYRVEGWRRLKALRVRRSGSDLYVPDIAQVRGALGLLRPRYRLIYYIILYTGFRLDHALRLLSSWSSLAGRVEGIRGSCVRVVLPPGWGSGVKREFYAYMPAWLKQAIDSAVDTGYRVPRRDTVYKTAARKGAVPPKYVRKFALHHMARLLGPEVAAHIGGHDPGSALFRAVARTSTTTRHYVSVEDLARETYWRYAGWLEESVAPRTLLITSAS